jgi:pyruvate/2-oxoglutarate dehydrogenase complex dihydrolipoamide dehydrogenase (E3) component
VSRNEPTTDDRFDLVIVGMGSAGMAGAEFAATLGLRVAVVERAHVGGAGLWSGSVPSKTLIASANAAHRARHAQQFGVQTGEVTVDLATVWERVRAVQRAIASTDDSPDRFTDLGVELLTGNAHVSGPQQVTVMTADGVSRQLATRAILLCTGSHPTVPDVPGLAEARFLTTDSFFEVIDPPSSLVIIGGGPAGVELAQACNRLGIAITLIHEGRRVLPQDEPLLSDLVLAVLRSEGVDVLVNATVTGVEVDETGKVVRATSAGLSHAIRAEEIVICAGRSPNLDGLSLEAVGVATTATGIVVDSRGRTAIKSIYAAGDVAGRYQFSHSGAAEAVRAVRDAFFPGRGNVDDLVPWCTFTDPELANVGLTVAEAEEQHGDDVDVWRIDLEHSDRARAEGVRTGAMVLVTAKARLVGAHILSPHAGDMIHELALAIRADMKLEEIASLVHVYPTFATSIGQLAAESAFDRAHRLRWLIRKPR